MICIQYIGAHLDPGSLSTRHGNIETWSFSVLETAMAQTELSTLSIVVYNDQPSDHTGTMWVP